jgi:hypothetical protein
MHRNVFENEKILSCYIAQHDNDINSRGKSGHNN